MTIVSKTHPRYKSLITREKISKAMKNNIVHETGLIAHGRGEAFDYLIGEKTIPEAEMAEKISAATLLCADNPVISLNGNVVALASEDCISLANSIPAKLEVNLFHRTQERMERIIDELHNKGAKNVFGLEADSKIPGLDHNRALCDREGIFSADVVLVPLEDGDRCEALRSMGKTVIAVDLNPLSRTAQTTNITIVDNVTRAIPNIERWVHELKTIDKNELQKQFEGFDNLQNLNKVVSFISKRLNSLY